MKKSKIAVILFPGINMETEMSEVINAVGMEASIVRWNESNLLTDFDGYVIPGGFSYEDRVRAGVIASKNKATEILRKEGRKGKPILGVCNGCQILIESGIVPGIESDTDVQMALAPNKNPFISGYYNTWLYIKNSSEVKRTAFNRFTEKNEIFYLPIAHGEGRFTTQNKGLIEELKDNDQIIFRYCDKTGVVSGDFPINPNGSVYSIAGISNKKGNVLAMMPHPERAVFNKHIPVIDKKNGVFAPSVKIFQSMKNYIEEELKDDC